MKKILSILVVCIMLAAIVMIPVSAAQTNKEVNALKFAKTPTIDGTLSEEEWGAPTYVVKASEAQDKDNASEGVSPDNTYLHISPDVDGEYADNMRNNFEYTIWLRWDENYYYVAVKVSDPDGHAATKTGKDIWANDAVQLRVDPQGPDSKQVATAEERGETFDWKTTEWDYTIGTANDKGAPFGADGGKVWNNVGKIINAGFALVGEIPSEYGPACWDMQSQTAMKGTLFQATTDFDPMADDVACVTNYEIAIPWEIIGSKLFGEDWKPEAETYLGMSLVVLSSESDVWLTWGCGVCGSQGYDARETCGGTNAIFLSTEEFTPAGNYATTPEPEGEKVDTSATLKPEFLETLDAGTHSVSFITDRSEYAFDLTILEEGDAGAATTEPYKVSSGEVATWKKGSAEGLTINAPSIAETISSIKIDKRPVETANYTIVQGYYVADDNPTTPSNPGGNNGQTPETTTAASASTPTQRSDRTTDEGGGFKWWIIPIIIAAVAAVGAGVFFFLKKKKQ